MPPKKKVVKRRRPKKAQDGDGIIDTVKAVVKRVKDVWHGVRKTASPSIRKFTAANGEAKITRIVVGRQPITPAVDKIASWISGGRWDANKKSLQYDKMLHLFMIVTLSNGKTIHLEKNHLPEISHNTSPGRDSMDAGSPAGITWNMMLAGAEKAAGGPEKLWVYDSITQNCQYFVRAVLKACGLLTPALEKFVMQNAAAVIEGLPWFEKVARKLTDTANVLDVARNGAGKKKPVEEHKTILCGCGARLRMIRPAHLATAKHIDGMKTRKMKRPKK